MTPRAAVLAEKGAAHSWRTFQLAFMLMQLPLLSDPAAPYRSGELARAQLLFLPTDGGKTEAYLGLAAYSFAIRRRQNIIETPDEPLDGRLGVAVVMRYTLRLLTAAVPARYCASMCRRGRTRRGSRDVGGRAVPHWAVGRDRRQPKRFDEAAAQLTNISGGRAYRLTVLQVQRCPWCGIKITPKNVRADPDRRRVYVYCGNELAICPLREADHSAKAECRRQARADTA